MDKLPLRLIGDVAALHPAVHAVVSLICVGVVRALTVEIVASVTSSDAHRLTDIGFFFEINVPASALGSLKVKLAPRDAVSLDTVAGKVSSAH